MTYKRMKIDPDKWTVLQGKDRHELEMVPGVLDVWFAWHADRDISINLLYTDGKKIPYAHGHHGHFNVQTFNLLSIVIDCVKATTIAVDVSYRDMAVKEKLDFTRLVITPPAPAMLKLQQMVRTEVARITGNADAEIEVGDEDNLEDDFEEEENFGPGYMEDEEPAQAVQEARTRRKPTSGIDPSGKPPSGVSDDPGAAEAPSDS